MLDSHQRFSLDTCGYYIEHHPQPYSITQIIFTIHYDTSRVTDEEAQNILEHYKKMMHTIAEESSKVTPRLPSIG